MDASELVTLSIALTVTTILAVITLMILMVVGLARVREIIAANRVLLADRARMSHTQERFLIILAHELRTPLTSVLAYTDMLVSGQSPDMMETYVQGIQRGSLRLQLLVDQAVVSLRSRLDIVPFDIAEAIRALLERYTVWVATRRQPGIVDIRYLGEEYLLVHGDVFMLETAVLELVRNGVKATEPGGAVTIDARRLNGEYVIQVRDTGMGIDPDILNRLFTRHALDYVDMSDTREFEGAALGLQVVSHVVNLHGGKIEVDSELGRGSTFTLVLPIADE